MENTDTIQITISGKIGNVPVSPDNYDIRQAKLVLDLIEDMLYPGKKGKQHAPITYSISDGCVVNKFKTSIQAAMGFLAAMTVVAQTGRLDTLELPVAEALEKIQKDARQTGLTYNIGSPNAGSPSLTISSATDFKRSPKTWAEAEFYLYGEIVDAGGKTKSTVQLRTKEYGILHIEADKESLRNIEHNILYRNYEIVAQGRQNIWTGEMDKTSLKIISMKGHNPKYDEERLNRLIAKATPAWVGITDPAVWVADLRGLSD